MSVLAWIDFDEAERQRAQRIMALFHESETRDELGLGAIRDSVSEHLFPGTSTIQTRLRYMLFVPWLFRKLENMEVSESRLPDEARELEDRLRQALEAGGERVGVIGSGSGIELQRLPSAIYWAGLGTWGIREYSGSIDSFFASLRHHKRSRGDDTAGADGPNPWSGALPEMPDKLLERAVFALTSDEAQFVVDRLVAARPEALLTFLARERIHAECDDIWAHPHLARFPAGARRLVGHAQIFSDVMHGAALVYNLALSELRQCDDWIGRYNERLDSWRDGLDLAKIETWSLEDFWATVEHPVYRIRPAAKRFVKEWRELVLARKGQVGSASAAGGQLVEARERRLKTSQSRYANTAVLDRWNGASGTARLNYRWPYAKSHLKDVADAG